MRNIALVIIAGLLATESCSRTPPVLPTDSQRSEPGPAEGSQSVRVEKQPVETPLVAKLLPDATPREPARRSAEPAPVDGQLSPGGNFSFSSARHIWVPVDKGNRRYTHNRRPVTAAHLIAEHNHHPSCANQWTQEELDIAHANDHAAEVRAASAPQGIVYESACPNGQCGNAKAGRGLFGRWR